MVKLKLETASFIVLSIFLHIGKDGPLWTPTARPPWGEGSGWTQGYLGGRAGSEAIALWFRLWMLAHRTVDKGGLLRAHFGVSSPAWLMLRSEIPGIFRIWLPHPRTQFLLPCLLLGAPSRIALTVLMEAVAPLGDEFGIVLEFPPNLLPQASQF